LIRGFFLVGCIRGFFIPAITSAAAARGERRSPIARLRWENGAAGPDFAVVAAPTQSAARGGWTWQRVDGTRPAKESIHVLSAVHVRVAAGGIPRH
jgi:hypothetical protein